VTEDELFSAKFSARQIAEAISTGRLREDVSIEGLQGRGFSAEYLDTVRVLVDWFLEEPPSSEDLFGV
jgi:hypothetical protein